MARKLTLQDIDQQIAELQRKKDALKESEKAGVAERIKDAIAYYEFTPADLFGGKKSKSAKKARKGAGRVKYRDDAGNTWSGFGPKPRWFLAALEAGKSPEDLAV